jgi:hypothetical protein
MTTRIGTSHFVSLDTACRYYADYDLNREQVEAKIKAGEIHIGPPACKSWQRLEIIDRGTRYGLIED